MNIKQQELLGRICEFFSKGGDDYYTFSDSGRLLEFIIENKNPLKRAFPFRNWCNLVKAKKRSLRTVKLMLKTARNGFSRQWYRGANKWKIIQIKLPKL